jgi:hypothetical protein
MTRLKALRDLKAKVEVGEYDVRAFRAVWPFSEGHDDIGSHALYAMKDNSLDAALAMHEAVLTGWNATVQTAGACYVYGPRGEHSASSSSPARAWLLAILSALISQEETQCR